jgi:hypothetical protein
MDAPFEIWFIWTPDDERYATRFTGVRFVTEDDAQMAAEIAAAESEKPYYIYRATIHAETKAVKVKARLEARCH